jgi:hypothetical protein
MRQPHVDDFVRLSCDVPQLALLKGEIGVIRSTWFAPAVKYEVEFHQIGHDYQTRCLLDPEEVVLEEGSLSTPDPADDSVSEYTNPT